MNDRVEDLDTRLDYTFFKTYELKLILSKIEIMAILDSLERNNWNQSKAADDLNMCRNTLKKKLVEHDIRVPKD